MENKLNTWKQLQQSDMPHPKLLNINQVSSGWINKYELTYRLDDGNEITYESVSRKPYEEYKQALLNNAEGIPAKPDAICIVPILPDDSLLLIREFRYPVNAWCIEFPAGLIEPDETIHECVDRELREETGYKIRTDLESEGIIPLSQTGYSSVGMGEENVLVVIAYVEPAGVANPMPGELIQQFALPREEVQSFLESNRELIGVRCQLLLEAVKRTQVLKKRIALLHNPLSSKDFAS